MILNSLSWEVRYKTTTRGSSLKKPKIVPNVEDVVHTHRYNTSGWASVKTCEGQNGFDYLTKTQTKKY